jgi:hypothetical protein
MRTAEQYDADAAEYLALAMGRDMPTRRATALLGIYRSLTVLAEQLRRLSQSEKDERRAA